MTRGRWLLLVLFVLLARDPGTLLAQAGCPGGTCVISGACTLAETQAAVNSAIDGNTIQLPANTTCNWNGALGITNKAITIQGYGPASTHIVSTNTSAPTLFSWFTKSTGGGAIPGIARIAHLWIDEGNAGYGANWHTVVFDGDTANMILQNVRFDFTRTQNHVGVFTTGYVRGVLQFSVFNMNASGIAAIVVQHVKWQNQGFYGDYSWAAASTLGTADAVYIEGSTFVCPAGIYCNVSDMDAGGRWVWRDNNFINGASITMHGPDTPGRSARAARQWENYFNRFADHATWASPHGLRSGTGVIFDEIGTNLATGFITDANYQPGDPTGLSHKPYGPFGDCRVRAVTAISCSANTLNVQGATLSFDRDVYMEIVGNSVSAYNGIKIVADSSGGTQHNKTNVFVAQACTNGTTGTGGYARPVGHGFAAGNSDGASAYPCADGIGRGPGAWLQGDFPFTGYGSGYNYVQVPTVMNQALEPARQWNVLYNGSQSDIVDRSGGVLATNRDWFDQNNATCVAGGACTSGNGRGNTLPTTCTAAVGGVTGARTGFWLRTDSSTNWNQEDATSHARHDPMSALHTLGEDGAFYTCNDNGTSWTKRYTPYTLPHPLLSGIAPPAGNQPPSISLAAPSSTGAYGTTATTASFGGGCTDDVACTAITYACAPACGSGSATGTNPWTLTGASVPLGTSVWTFTPADVATTGAPVTITVLRRATVSSLPYTDPHDATAVYPNLGPLYTIFGTVATQLGLTAAGTGIVNADGFGAAAFTGATVNADQYMDVRVLEVAPLSKQIRLCFRTTGTAGQTSDLDTYFIQFDGTASATNLIGRYDDGAFVHNYTPTGLGAITLTPNETLVGGQMIGTTIQARIDGLPVGPVVQTAGEYLTGTVANCSVGVGTRWDDTVIGNTSAPADTTPPTVAIDVPTSAPDVYPITAAMSPLTIQAAVADNVGIWSCSWSNSAAPGPTPVVPVAGRVSASVAITNAVTNTVTFTCQDAVGNTTSDSIPVVITIDPPPPVQRPVNLRGIFR